MAGVLAKKQRGQQGLMRNSAGFRKSYTPTEPAQPPLMQRIMKGLASATAPFFNSQQNLPPAFFDTRAPLDPRTNEVAWDWGPRGEYAYTEPPKGYAANPFTGLIYAVDEGTPVEDLAGMPEGMATESDRISNADAVSQIASVTEPFTGGFGAAATATKGLLQGKKFDPNMVNMHVWQGSPAKYGPGGASDSLKYMSTGEGAQMRGWGRYDAQAQDVGQTYKTDLGTNIEIDGTPFMANGKKLSTTGDDYADDLLLANAGDVDAAIKEITDDIANIGVEKVTKYGELDSLKVLRDLKSKTVTTNSGYLYKHDLPDEDIAKYLDWDAPLSEQPESVTSAIDKLMNDAGLWMKDADTITDVYGNNYNANGSGLYSALGHTTSGDAYTGVGQHIGDKAASEALDAAGIPGLKYFDGNSRSGAEGTRNFVTWNQGVLDRMKMLQRNDEVFPGVLGGKKK